MRPKATDESDHDDSGLKREEEEGEAAAHVALVMLPGTREEDGEEGEDDCPLVEEEERGPTENGGSSAAAAAGGTRAFGRLLGEVIRLPAARRTGGAASCGSSLSSSLGGSDGSPAAAAAAACCCEREEKRGGAGAGAPAPSNNHGDHVVVPAWVLSLLIASLGLAASCGFLFAGVRSSYREQLEQFDRASDDTVRRFRAAFQTYITAASLVHNRCRGRNVSRREFRELYEYVRESGLTFQALQFDPRILRHERRQAEEEARAFYALHYPHVNYRGFRGIETDNTNETHARAESDFYYPVHYMEPVVGNEAAIALDYHTSPSRRSAVEYCLTTGQPALTDRIRLVQERQRIYGVVLFHPGVNVSAYADAGDVPATAPSWPRDLASIVIRVPDMLGRAMEDPAGEDLAAYLFDPSLRYGGDGSSSSAGARPEEDPMFLGGARVVVDADADAAAAEPGGGAETASSPTCLQKRGRRALAFLPEARLRHVTGGHSYHKVANVSAANKVWTVVVVAAGGAFRPRGLVFVLLSSSMILLASVGLAYWYYSYTERVARLGALKAAAEAEKQALILEAARQAAVAERELNDFIAHEVRNPVAAAMSACSFVRHAVNGPNPLATDEARAETRGDVEVISNALHFVHDLLRNMLDIHRAASKDLVVRLRPTDLLRDVLEPVAAMLHQRRDSRIRLLVECPEGLHVNTDHLRLKQIALNLARNSTKFVDEGFIRLRAEVVSEVCGDDGGCVEISVEDSGPGIPEEKRDRLFSKFQASLDTLSQGTGLGLHLCKNLTELLGGELVLDAEYDSGVPGRPGTRFVVQLRQPPAKPNRVPSSLSVEDGELDDGGAVETSRSRLDAEAKDDSSSRGTHPDETTEQRNATCALPDRLSVLFVDDDAIQRKLFARKIKTLAPGWTVREAANGETALLLAEQQSFDVIFMDQYMASVEKQLLGTEAVQALRSQGVASRICGLSANDKEAEFLEAGADAFCIKPFPCEAEAMTVELLRILMCEDHTK